MRLKWATVGFLAGMLVAALSLPLDIARIRWWWLSYDVNCGASYSNCTDGYKTDSRNLELRRRVGPILASITPGYSTCKYCGAPWSLVDGHTIWYEKTPDGRRGSGRFALCEECWRRLVQFGRFKDIYEAYLKDTHEPKRSQIEAALFEELKFGPTNVGDIEK